MEPEGSLPHSQQPATYPYHEPHQSSSCPPPRFLKICFNTILPSMPGLLSGFFQPGFPTKILYASLLSPRRATCPAHLILLDLPEYLVITAHKAPHDVVLFTPPVTSSLLGPNILLDTLFSNTLSLRSSFHVSDQVSHT